jgi:hypothetical protein
MATFPSLEPTTRSLTYGDYPQLTHAAASGANVRFLMGTDRLKQRLQITYEYLTEAEATLLLDHYEGQEGGLIPFDLSSQVWSGYTSAPVSSSDYQWRYSKSFSIGLGAPMQYNCSIDLETVPI